MLSRAVVALDGTLRVLPPGLSLVFATTKLMTSPISPPILDRDQMSRDEWISVIARDGSRFSKALVTGWRWPIRRRLHLVDVGPSANGQARDALFDQGLGLLEGR